MSIKPIKTKQDHRDALKQIEQLLDARPNTPEGHRLDILTTLVEAWEEKHHPIEPPEAERHTER